MKKLILSGLILLSVGVLVYKFDNDSKKLLPSPTPLPSPSATASGRIMGLVENEDDLQRIEVDGKVYRYSWTTSGPEYVTVGVNSDLIDTSSALRSSGNCRVLVNGGFYNTNNQPIGLIVNRGEELSPWQENSLLNGVIGWNRDLGQIEVSYKDREIWWGVQAGPVLWFSGEAVPLKMVRDQEARRMVGGVTKSNELFIVTIMSESSLFGGPKLVELPTILEKIQEREGIGLTSAINLDGGTASAFLTSGIQLKELKPIGSFLCIN